MEQVVVFSPGGGVRSMHSDKFSLGFLGRQNIRRASDIRFNVDTQLWDIWFVHDGEYVEPTPEYARFPGYEAARDFEVRVVNRCLEQGVPAHCHTIRNWAFWLR